MKTTAEQRAELRRLADKHSLLKWPELIDLLDDFDTLEAQKSFLEEIVAACGITDIDYEKRNLRARASINQWHGVWGTKG